MLNCMAMREKIKYPVFVAGLILLIFTFYNVYESNGLFVVGMGVLFLSIVLMKISDLFLVATILAPNLMMIKNINYPTALFGYFMIIIFMKYAIVYKPGWKILRSLLIHSFFVTITTMIYVQPSIITSLIRTASFVSLLNFMFKRNEFSSLGYKDKVIRCYIIGTMLCVILGIVYYILKGLNIFDGLFAGIKNDRNYFSALLSSGVAITLLYVTYSRKKMIFWIIAMFTMLFGGILSASRTFFLSLIFIVVLAVLLLTQNKTNWRMFRIMIIAGCLVLVFWGSVSPAVIRVLERFTEEDMEGGNGRFDAWQYYLELTFSSVTRVLFGNGSAIAYIQKRQIGLAEHNTFVQMLSTIGTLGSITLIRVYHCVYNTIVKIKKRNRIQYFIPLICTLFCYSGISGLYSDNLNFSLFISFIIISYCKQKDSMKAKEKLKSIT